MLIMNGQLIVTSNLFEEPSPIQVRRILEQVSRNRAVWRVVELRLCDNDKDGFKLDMREKIGSQIGRKEEVVKDQGVEDDERSSCRTKDILQWFEE